MINSLDIARKTSMSHRHVLNRIKHHEVDFIESTYMSEQNKELPCALLDAKNTIKLMSRLSKGKMIIDSFIDCSIDTANKLLDAIESMDIDDPEMMLYLMREVDSGNVKIGISKHPKERVRQLQVGNSSEIELIAIIGRHSSHSIESATHKALSNHLVRGEWFTSNAIQSLEVINAQ